MARVFTEGFEMKDLLFFNRTTGGASISTTSVRSGAACVLITATEARRNLTTPLSEFYVRFALGVANNNGPVTIFKWYNGTTEHGSLRLEGGLFRFYTSVNTLVGTGTRTIPLNHGYVLVEVHILIADSGGKLELRLDGADELILNSLDTKPAAFTNIDNLSWAGPNGTLLYFDDFALNDTSGAVDNSWCGDGHVVALVPNGNGDVSQLVGSDGNSIDNYALVDEIPVGSSPDDYAETSTPGNYDLYQLSDMGMTGVVVKRLWVEARAHDTIAAGGLCQLGIKSGGVETWSPNISLLTGTSQIKGPEHIVNPNTSQAWTIDEVNALQAGFKGQ